MSIFQLLIFQPLYNLLALSSTFTNGDLGWAVLILASVIRLAIWPLYKKAMGDQRKMTKLQPKIKEIQKKFKEEPMKISEETIKVFKEEKVNPGSIILFFVLQIVIFLSLYSFFKQAIVNDWSIYLYNFIKLPEQINYLFFGIINLKTPSLILAVISVGFNLLLTFIQPSSGQNKTMLFGFPFLILLLYKNFPAIVILYWIGFTLVNILQEYIINKDASSTTKILETKIVS